jgi:hypothetical protein
MDAWGSAQGRDNMQADRVVELAVTAAVAATAKGDSRVLCHEGLRYVYSRA